MADANQTTFKSHPEPVFIVNLQDWSIYEANPAAASMLGYSLDEYRHMALHDLLSADGAAQVAEHCAPENCSLRPMPAGLTGLKTKAGNIILFTIYCHIANRNHLMVLAKQHHGEPTPAGADRGSANSQSSSARSSAER